MKLPMLGLLLRETEILLVPLEMIHELSIRNPPRFFVRSGSGDFIALWVVPVWNLVIPTPRLMRILRRMGRLVREGIRVTEGPWELFRGSFAPSPFLCSAPFFIWEEVKLFTYICILTLPFYKQNSSFHSILVYFFTLSHTLVWKKKHCSFFCCFFL